jgi:hypothetical protein
LQQAASDKVAATASVALTTVSAVPTDRHPIAFLESFGTAADFFDYPDDFVAGDNWIYLTGKHP